MSLTDKLKTRETWEEFRNYKSKKGQLSKSELNDLSSFIENEEYLFYSSSYTFSYPVKKLISKTDTKKKRTVYFYDRKETWLLKLSSFLLYEYEYLFPDNLYSFRRNRTAKHAFDSIRKIKNLDDRYVLKLDIHDYFNSISPSILMERTEKLISDTEFLSLFRQLLFQDKCIFDGQVLNENRGAMAGVPLSSFFANIYLIYMDNFFLERNIPYYRYSDDIIIFCDSKEQSEEYLETIKSFLTESELTLNEEKLRIYQPREGFEFLGFRYHNGQIDLSDITVKKMKAKLRRKTKRLRRKMETENRSFVSAAVSLIRHFDYKFYDLTGTNDFTWTRFYFPVLTTKEGLSEIDRYFVQCIRYLKTGVHNAGNYRLRYENIRKLGYTPLVYEYYKWKKENRLLKKQYEEQQKNRTD